jgi:transcriptional regulator with XRE-family HTH domain
MSLGKYIKAVRNRRGISQWELSRLSGLTRSHISRLELDDYENPTAETFLALARALKIHPNELYQAAGYIEEHGRFRKGPHNTIDETIASLEIQPVNIPVASDIERLKAGVFDLGQITSWSFADNGSMNAKGLLVRGFSLEPEVREGDVIIVSTDVPLRDGNIVLSYLDEKLSLTRYSDEMTALDQVYGTVIGVNRRLL